MNKNEISRRQALNKIVGGLLTAGALELGLMGSGAGYAAYTSNGNRDTIRVDRSYQSLDEIDLETPTEQIQPVQAEIIQPAYLFNETEFETPGNIPIGQESDVLLLAKTLYCEARHSYKEEPQKEVPRFIVLVADTVQQRSSLTGKSLKEVIAEPGQYSFLNKGASRNHYFVNPLFNTKKHPEDKTAWEVCYCAALEKLNQGPFSDEQAVTHFWSNCVKEPKWARGIPPRYTKVDKLDKKVITRFYFRPELLG